MQRVTAGTFVTPSIRLVEPLGQGAMGCVWVADHLTLHSRVAVKFLSTALASDGESVERFAREASNAAQVRSPHVVQVFDYGVGDEGTPFIVMELLEGTDLATRLHRDKRLPLHVVASIVDQACKALSRAHSRGVIHRDVKPENIFLCDEQEAPFVKLLDFGIAKARMSQSLTGFGVWLGSPSYMSPEQISGVDEVDGRSDLWSLGVVAYEALTGTRPFRGATFHEVLAMIRSGEHVPPSQVCSYLPRAVDAWFARACAVDRDRRFADAAEMSRAFALASRQALELSDTFVSLRASVPTSPASVPTSPASAPTSRAPSSPAAMPLARPARSYTPVAYDDEFDDDHHPRPSVHDITDDSIPRRSAFGLLALAAIGAGAFGLAVFYLSHRAIPPHEGTAAVNVAPVTSSPPPLAVPIPPLPVPLPLPAASDAAVPPKHPAALPQKSPKPKTATSSSASAAPSVVPSTSAAPVKMKVDAVEPVPEATDAAVPETAPKVEEPTENPYE